MIHDRWIDHQNERIFPKFRLVKEITAHLALKWLHDSFPEAPIIFMMRHPCVLHVVQALGLGHLYGDSTLSLNRNVR